MHLTRTGTKIHKRDSALETYDSSDTRDFRRDLFVTGFRFQDDDDNTATWRPQGLSGSADASTSGAVDGRKFLLVGWYYYENSGEPGDIWPLVDGGTTWVHPMRVSLVDVTSMDDISYRHILLVQPTADGSSFEPAEGHCGGIVWYGRWLFVQGTTGLNVFDMQAIQDLSTSNPDYASSNQVGISGGVGHAAGYRYIVPRLMTYTLITDTLDADPFATLGLDRTSDPPRLVAAAWVVEPGYNEANGTHYQDDVDQRVVVFWDLGASELPYPLESSAAANTGLYYVQGYTPLGTTSGSVVVPAMRSSPWPG